MNKIYLLQLLCFLLFLSPAFSQKNDYCFRYINTKEGLSNNYVTSIVQDHDGFIWIGTPDGLNKYDGNKFVLYRNDPANPNSLSHNLIRRLFVDRKGNLWIGTHGGGLSMFKKETNTFVNYKNNPSDNSSISNNTVLGIDEDVHGNLWIGTRGGGLNYFDIEKKKFVRFRNNPSDNNSLSSDVISDVKVDRNNNLWIATRGEGGLDKLIPPSTFVHYKNSADPHSISSNYLTDIFEDSRGNLWIGTDGSGMNLYNPSEDNFIRYQSDEGQSNSIGNNYVYAIYEDGKGDIWIGMENGGVSILRKDHKTIVNIKSDDRKDCSINNNSIHSLFRDNKGNMWVGTYSGGINFFSAEPEAFKNFRNDRFDPNSLNNNNVLSICLIEDNHLLLGTDGGGLNFLDLSKRNFKHYTQNGKINGIPSNYVLAAFEDKDGDIWIGTYKGGLSLFNKKEGSFYNFPINATENGCSDRSVGHIIQDHLGYIWIANYGQGISRYDKKTRKFKHYFSGEKPGNLSHGVVFTMYEDKKGNVWVGTEGGGLNLFDRKTDTFQAFKNVYGNKNTLSNDIVNAIYEDSGNRFWVGTNDGLNLFDRDTKTFRAWFEKDGLSNNVVQSIIEDDKGFLWIGTYKGMSKLDPRSMLFKNYSLSNGLQGNSYNKNSRFKDSKGRLYMGGLNGFDIFHPDSVYESKDLPSVFLTDFKLFNKSVAVGDKDSILPKSLRFVRSITLDHTQSSFAFDFIALDYSHPDESSYAYKLEGFNHDWVYIGKNKTAIYTNLNPGEYVFKVKASNNEGVWGKNETSIRLVIKPPFWSTWWFRITLLGILVFLVVFFFNAKTRYIRLKNKWLTEEVLKRTDKINEQKEEILLQKNNLEEKSLKLSIAYKDIQDSIQYAKTIQDAMLQNIASAQQSFEEIFVLLKPRDVVSGDFYWFARKKEKIIIAAVDCTGHGVPGAFMSMIGNALLNQIVNVDGIVGPDLILSELNRGIRTALKQDETKSKDGMDMALCVIDKEKRILEYSGAYNPLYIIQNGELISIKADSISIGGGMLMKEMPFTRHTVDISIPTRFYIFSDGFQDQIGGPEGIKFTKLRLRDLFLEIHEKPMEEQKEILNATINKWMGENEQRDDMLIIGVKI